MVEDIINKPKHYIRGDIELIQAQKASMTHDQLVGYLKGQIMKYTWRFDLKNGSEDLSKAQFYLTYLKEVYQDAKRES